MDTLQYITLAGMNSKLTAITVLLAAIMILVLVLDIAAVLHIICAGRAALERELQDIDKDERQRK